MEVGDLQDDAHGASRQQPQGLSGHAKTSGGRIRGCSPSMATATSGAATSAARLDLQAPEDQALDRVGFAEAAQGALQRQPEERPGRAGGSTSRPAGRPPPLPPRAHPPVR
jgi:hypothetical protein